MKFDNHWTDAVVESTEILSQTVRALRLAPAGGVQPFAPGSHLRVQVAVDGRDELRHYSLVGLAAAARADGCYRIAVKRDDGGRGGSRAMWQLRAGERITIAGPESHFELPVAAPHVLLVAGGIGVTPIVGMAQALAARGASLRLAYAVRDEADLVFADELRAALGGRLATFVGARGERLDLDAEIAALPAGAALAICGPVPLLQAARQAWSRAGRAPALLRFETFGSGGGRANEAFRVRLPRHGVDVVVPAHRSLLDVLEEQGVELLSDCRRGECGLCAVDIVSLQGELDHRDVFLSEAERRAGRRLCACVSRVCGTVELDSAWRPDEPVAPTHAEAA